MRIFLIDLARATSSGWHRTSRMSPSPATGDPRNITVIKRGAYTLGWVPALTQKNNVDVASRPQLAVVSRRR